MNMLAGSEPCYKTTTSGAGTGNTTVTAGSGPATPFYSSSSSLPNSLVTYDTRVGTPSHATADKSLVLSPVHEAFTLVASRILRPIWLQTVATADERPVIPSSRAGGGYSAAPIWSRGLIASIRTPLLQLILRLQELHPTVLQKTPSMLADLNTESTTSTSNIVMPLGEVNSDDPNNNTNSGYSQAVLTGGRQLMVRQMEAQARLHKNPERAKAMQARYE